MIGSKEMEWFLFRTLVFIVPLIKIFIIVVVWKSQKDETELKNWCRLCFEFPLSLCSKSDT